MFLLLDAAHGRVQVLLFTFESVRKGAGKSKRRWWWHTRHCWARVRVPAASPLLPAPTPGPLPTSSGTSESLRTEVLGWGTERLSPQSPRLSSFIPLRGPGCTRQGPGAGPAGLSLLQLTAFPRTPRS